MRDLRHFIYTLVLLAFLIYFVGWLYKDRPPSIPHCSNALDIIVGNGEYNKQTGYWSEYDCVSDWRDAARISIKRGAK